MQLRKKIEPDPKLPRYILTIPRFGYRFESPLEERKLIRLLPPTPCIIRLRTPAPGYDSTICNAPERSVLPHQTSIVCWATLRRHPVSMRD